MLRQEFLQPTLAGTDTKIIRRRLQPLTLTIRSVEATKQEEISLRQRKVVGALILTRVYPDRPITVYRRFSGVGASGQTGEEFVEGLDNTVITGRRGRVTVTAGVDEYIYVGVPVAGGKVSIRYNGYEGGFRAPKTVIITDDLTNAQVEYYLYESINDNLGTVTLDIY